MSGPTHEHPKGRVTHLCGYPPPALVIAYDIGIQIPPIFGPDGGSVIGQDVAVPITRRVSLGPYGAVWRCMVVPFGGSGYLPLRKDRV